MNTFASPAWKRSGLGSIWTSSPVVATIDGVKAVVIGSQSGAVYVMNAKTGNELPGWPQHVHIRSATPTAIDSSPAVAYLDGPNSAPSIVVGAGSLWRKNQEGGVEAFRANGSVRFVFKTKATFIPWGGGAAGYSDPVFATPAVGDITGSGQLDIVFGSFDHFLYALQPNGRLVPGFPISRADTIWSLPTLADTRHLGRDDIIEGSDSSGLNGCWGGWLTDYRYTALGPRLIWSKCLAESVWSSPTVATINSTHRPVVIVGTGWNFSIPAFAKSAASREIFAFYADNGAPVPGWPVKSPAKNGWTFGSPAVGKVDGQLAIVSTSCAHCLNGPATVSAWSAAGHLLWTSTFNVSNEALSSPALVDLSGGADRGNDVLVGNAGGLYLLDGRTGHYLYTTGSGWNSLQPACDVAGAPAVSYVPGGRGTGWMLFVACGGPRLSGTVAAFPFPTTPSANLPPAWPEWRANAARTGVADPLTGVRVSCSDPSTPAGYRFVAADGSVNDFGNLEYCGGANQLVLPSRVVGMATSPRGGYWLLLADGTVYAFGDAAWHGDLRGSRFTGGPQPPGAPVVGITASPDGRGYLVASANGNVYAFGDAVYFGSKGGKAINGQIVGISVDQKTGGYWLVTAKGSVYALHAPNHGWPAARTLTAPIVGIAGLPDGSGYYLVGARGSVRNFGQAHFYGSAARLRLGAPIVGMALNRTSNGYWLAGADGGIFRYGGAASHGSSAARRAEPITAFSAPPPTL